SESGSASCAAGSPQRRRRMPPEHLADTESHRRCDGAAGEAGSARKDTIMIRVHIARDRDFGRPNQQHFDQGVYEETIFEALRRLVMAELRFGASVTHLSPTELHLFTRMLGDRDTSEFTGSEEEMRPLLTAVDIYLRN